MTETFPTTNPTVVGTCDDERIPTEELHDVARKRLEERRDFRTHVVVYLTVNAMLWAIYAAVAVTTGVWIPWPVFPMLGWGVGLVIHAWTVYGDKPITEADVRAEMDRLTHT